MMSLDFLTSSPCEEEAGEGALVLGVSLLVDRFSSSACPSRTVPWRVYRAQRKRQGATTGPRTLSVDELWVTYVT